MPPVVRSPDVTCSAAKFEMSCHRKLSRCYVFSRCTVCLMISGVKLWCTNGASAYSPAVIPSQNHVQRLRSETRLNSSAPAVNGLTSKKYSHSTSLFDVGYDAKSIIDFYDKRPWEVGLRLNMLGFPLLCKLHNLLSLVQFIGRLLQGILI